MFALPAIVLSFFIALITPTGQDDGAPPAVTTPPAASRPAPALVPERLYNGLNRPVMIRIEGAAADDSLSLVLMDVLGNVLAEAGEVRPGRVDLADGMPDIWRIRKACFLQLIRNGEPAGPSLVLQPMLSRLTLWTKRDVRPDGRTPYTRIVGWGPKPQELLEDEARRRAELARAEEARRNQPINRSSRDFGESDETDGSGESDASGDPPPETEISEPEPEPEPDPLEVYEEQVFSGLRIYVERDVVMETTLGDIGIAMVPSEAPGTVWNFLDLCRGGYYDNVPFHRIVPAERNGYPFVIQGGDPTGTGEGGPGYPLPIEPSLLPHDFGVISMARADDPDSAGGQFFICLSRAGTARLDGQYCAFGYAVTGGPTIRAIAEVKLADVAAGVPEDPPLITAVRFLDAPPRTPGTGRPDRRVSLTDETTTLKPIRVPR